MNSRSIFPEEDNKIYSYNSLLVSLAKTESLKKNSPIIYPTDKLSILLNSENIDRQDSLKVVRFLLRNDGTLVFANEGYPCEDIPAHCQMAGALNFENATCLTAGNCFFDEKNNLVRINHKSGDFRPSFASLQLALKAIINSDIRLCDKITIQELNASGGNKADYLISTTEIKAMLESVSLPGPQPNINKDKATENDFERSQVEVIINDFRKSLPAKWQDIISTNNQDLLKHLLITANANELPKLRDVINIKKSIQAYESGNIDANDLIGIMKIILPKAKASAHQKNSIFSAWRKQGRVEKAIEQFEESLNSIAIKSKSKFK